MKCPKCKKETDILYIRQKFQTKAFGTLDKDGNKIFDDMEAGYTLLDEWLNNMLSEHGNPEVLGCKNCKLL